MQYISANFYSFLIATKLNKLELFVKNVVRHAPEISQKNQNLLIKLSLPFSNGI